MANNRMYLANKSTGEKVCIAKFYPSTGWYCEDQENLVATINAIFHKHDFGGISFEEARSQKGLSHHSPLGDINWRIEFEEN